jgi:hypothetical protein
MWFVFFIDTTEKFPQVLNNNNGAGRVAQVVEHTPSKYEALKLKPQYHQNE